jgi:Arc/MetJ-type ribon-helix-helix transcriptional regulator
MFKVDWQAIEKVCEPLAFYPRADRIESSRLTSVRGMTYGNTRRYRMGRSKIAISLDQRLLHRLDSLVKKEHFPSRSQAIQEAVEEKLVRIGKSRLAQECAKLDPAFEKALAEEGLSKDISEWPEY